MARKDVTNGYISQDMTDANDNFIELYGAIDDAKDGEATLLAKEQAQDAAILAATGGTSSLVSAADTLNGYLNDKLTSTGGTLTKTIASPAGNEKLNFEITRFGVTTTSSAVDITLTSASTLTQQITMTAADKFVIMPAATGLLESEEWNFFNAGNLRFGIKDSTGVFIGSIDAQSFGRMKLIDNSTAAGTWEAIDGADLIMNTLKTVCNAEAVSEITQCKLTATDVFVAFKADSKGKAVVMKLGATITLSNVLIFETGAFTQPFATRNSDTVAMVSYRGPDDDGYIAAITYNGTDTIVTTHTYEFLNAATVSQPKHSQITSALVSVVYYVAEGTAGIRGQVLNWTGSEFTANTAETPLVAGSDVFPDIFTISGSASAATINIFTRGGANQSNKISWNGTALSLGSAGTVPGAAYDKRSTLLIDSTYAVSFFPITSTYEHRLELWNISGATPALIKYIFLPADVPATSGIGSNCLTLMDTGEVLLFRSIRGGLAHKIYKIKVVGSASWKAAVLKIVSEIESESYSSAGSISSVSSTAAIISYINYEGSQYLAAEKVSVA